MSRRNDPFAALPFAVVGLIVGLGLSGLCGNALLHRWTTSAPPSADLVVIEGPVEWAGWRRSRHAEGPVWFLQLRLTTDARGFLVAASDLPGDLQAQLRGAGARRNGKRLSSLIGTQAAIGVAPRFQEAPRPPHPYVRMLRVDGATVVSPNTSSSDADGTYALLASVLVGIGSVVGLAMTGVSAHHLVVCVRYRSAGV